VTKVPSRRQREAAAVLAGLAALGIASRDVRCALPGTTVGTNAVPERRGARVAVLTTAAFPDLIEIGRTKRNIPALFVPTFVRPKPVVERSASTGSRSRSGSTPTAPCWCRSTRSGPAPTVGTSDSSVGTLP